MPDRLSYDEAILYSQHCLKIQDADLKQGAVETYTGKTHAGDIKKPWGQEGGFAVVYKFRAHSGQMKAMRCFRVAMNSDTQSRYERMSQFFPQHVPDITIDFRYYEQGILVKEAAQNIQKIVCPVIVMEWIDGVTLLVKVDELCKRRDCQALGQLAQQWLAALEQMRAAHMAHGDLAGVNVMVRTNGQLALIDYDGVYIPEFAGLPQVVLGQQGYQHPDMLHRPFSEQMDDFSAMVIYLSLLALHERPERWDKYVPGSAGGQLDGNMIFTGDDFAKPDTSPLFAELLRSADSQVRAFASALKDACKQPVDQVRFPLHLADPDYRNKQALQRLEQAIRRDDDEQIIALWVAPLTGYAPAQQYQPRAALAQKRVAALAALKRALATQNVMLIADAAIPEALNSPRLSGVEREIVRLALAFAQAYRGTDDEQIVDRWQDIQNSPARAALQLDQQAQQRLEQAQRRQAALTQFRLTCYRSRNAHDIVRAYDPILDGSPALSRKERDLLDDARRYLTMYDAVRDALALNNGQGDMARLYDVYDEELDNRFADFTDEERKRIATLKNFGKLDRALKSKAYRLALVTARDLEMQTRTPITDNRLSIARMNFIKAFEVKNLRVQMQNGLAYAHWDWPNDELVQVAALVWRDDRWPLHPRKDDPGRVLYMVNRGFYEQYGGYQFPVGLARQVYVQVYFALSEFMAQTNEIYWFYSRGDEPTSKWPERLAS